MDVGQPSCLPGFSRRRTRASRRHLVTETALSRRFEFETLEPRVLMSADLLPVHGSIDVPGQTAAYNFTVTGPKPHEFYFDSRTANGTAINWSLEGPRGVEVDQRSFEYSDASDLGGRAALSLVPGDYTLSVAGAGAGTGAYDFQLLDLANAAPVVVGQQVDGRLGIGNETDLYRFDAVAGDTVVFDGLPLTPQSTSWRVTGPEGAVVFGPTSLAQDTGSTKLTRTGSYTVMVEGNPNQAAPADYSFTVHAVATTQAPLTLGQAVAGSLATPGRTDQYDFTITQPTKVLFDSLANRGDLRWSLSGSKGDLVTDRTFQFSDGARLAGDDGVALAAGASRTVPLMPDKRR